MSQLEPMAIWMPTLLLVTVRVAGIMVVAPVFAHSAVPVKVRLITSAAMGLAVVGRLARPVALPAGWFDLCMGLGCEFLVGAAIGYAARLIFAGVELGAFHVSQQMGLALESAQFYEETQRRAVREQVAREVTARMRETLDVEAVLKTTAQEVRQALGLPEVVVRLRPSQPEGSLPERAKHTEI